MRTTTFILFGLTAAAGLALVAIFAQPGGPLLPPAPLPSEPTSSVGKAQVVSASAAPRHARHSLVIHRSADGSSGSGSQRSQTGGVVGGGSGGSGAPATVKVAAPHSVGPQPASGGGSDESGGGAPETTAPQPTPPPAPEAAPAPESVPVSSPAPAPGKVPSVHISLPGNSGSGHSSDKEIAATVHAIVEPPPATPPPPAIPSLPGLPTSPGGNGHGHGHDK